MKTMSEPELKNVFEIFEKSLKVGFVVMNPNPGGFRSHEPETQVHCIKDEET